MHDLEVASIGERSALATVTRKNLRRDGSMASQWGQSYNVVRFAESWRILAATFHLSTAQGHSRSALPPTRDMTQRRLEVRSVPIPLQRFFGVTND
jgi:hypothetical protein